MGMGMGMGKYARELQVSRILARDLGAIISVRRTQVESLRFVRLPVVDLKPAWVKAKNVKTPSSSLQRLA